MSDVNSKKEFKPRESNKNDLWIVLGIIMLFFMLVIVNREWIYNYIGWVDGWAYFGYSYNPIMMRKVFPDHPLGDLLPLVLPAGLFYSIFEAFWANLFYKMLFFTLSGWIMYKILKMEFDYKTAILGTISLLLYKNFLASMGCDYTEGRVILYYLASIFFVLKAVESDRHNLYLFMAGLFFSFSVSTALLSIVYVVVLFVLYCGKKIQFTGKIKSLFSISILFIPAGFISGVLLLCLIHYSYTGKFIYFYNTINKAVSFLETGRGAPSLNFSLHWLAIPLFTLCQGVVYAIYLLLKNKNVHSIFRERWFVFLGASITSLLVMSYLQVFKNQNTIQDFYYFNQTIPITFIAMSAIFYSPFAKCMDNKTFKILSAGFIFLGIIQFGYYSSMVSPHSIFINKFSITTAIIWILCVCITLYVRNKSIYVISFVIGFFILNISPEPSYRLLKSCNATEDVPNRKTAMYLSIEWIKYMNKIDPQRKAYLWYDKRDSRAYRVGLAASSHLWQGRIYNEFYPDCNVVMGEVGVVNPEVLTQQPLIIISDEDKTLEVAIDNLKKINIDLSCENVNSFIYLNKKYFDVYVCKCKKRG
jgi:hypothetical protein